MKVLAGVLLGVRAFMKVLAGVLLGVQKLQAASAAQKKVDKKSKKAGGSGVQPSMVPFNRETDLEIRKQVDPTKLVARWVRSWASVWLSLLLDKCVAIAAPGQVCGSLWSWASVWFSTCVLGRPLLRPPPLVTVFTPVPPPVPLRAHCGCLCASNVNTHT
jgi:hypothetical protein